MYSNHILVPAIPATYTCLLSNFLIQVISTLYSQYRHIIHPELDFAKLPPINKLE